MTDPEIIITADGSHTLYSREFDQHYHSIHGAVTESRHIFIEAGLHHALARRDIHFTGPLNILEIGFGTGLNALLTLAEAERNGIRIHYTAIEAYPLTDRIWRALNYPVLFGSADYHAVFSKLHLADWEKPESLSACFTLLKHRTTLESYSPTGGYFDLVYFDAFDPAAQPELWTPEIFSKLHQAMKPGGILVTYSVKGTVTRTLRSSGFQIEKLPGPPGKRHILRAGLISL